MKTSNELPDSEKRARGAIHLYVFELEGGHLHVGITHDIDKRRLRHQKGKGAGWTARRPLCAC